MFGIGPTELVIIVLLLLIVFGPGKTVSMARDLGRFVSEARRPVEEFKSELASSEEVKETRRAAEKLKSELIPAGRSVDEFKGKLISGEDQKEPAASDSHPEDDDKEVGEPQERKESSPDKEQPSSS